jgi:tRNA pseudouridine55 synthase
MSRRRPSRIHGLLAVNKRPGPTSHDMVDLARGALGERRVGHTGTLDPMAQGLLLLCVGQATRLQQYLLRWDKTYRGLIRLGHATTTYDREGEPVEPSGTPPVVDQERLDALRAAFTGEIDQVPPPYSAKKVAGKKLYELARSGKQVTVDAKRVTVHSLDLAVEEADLLSLEVRSSTGFYVRSLAHDIGCKLGCGAHLHRLERVRIGPFRSSIALDHETLSSAKSAEEITGSAAWIPLSKIELPFESLVVKAEPASRFQHGQEAMVFRPGGNPIAQGDLVTVRSESDRLLGIGTVQTVLARGRTLAVRPTLVLDVKGPQ